MAGHARCCNSGNVDADLRTGQGRNPGDAIGYFCGGSGLAEIRLASLW
jgi:hypothetical protein